jgi:hypothetical protein
MYMKKIWKKCFRQKNQLSSTRYSLLGYSHKRPLCNRRHIEKTTQTAVTPPETLVSCNPGRLRNRISHVSVPGLGTLLT